MSSKKSSGDALSSPPVNRGGAAVGRDALSVSVSAAVFLGCCGVYSSPLGATQGVLQWLSWHKQDKVFHAFMAENDLKSRKGIQF